MTLQRQTLALLTWLFRLFKQINRPFHESWSLIGGMPEIEDISGARERLKQDADGAEPALDFFFGGFDVLDVEAGF
jgi:hypothetical protein